MLVLQPPTPLPAPAPDHPSIFLAGSIEMGSAPPWQDRLIADLADTDLIAFNPRRDDWDPSWTQSIDTPQFRAQVEWELAGLEHAELVAMVLVPGTRSPISLLELGLHATSGRLVVCCPEGFWRKGNVDIVCQRYGIPQAASHEALVAHIRQWLGRRLRGRDST
ncbi:MAG: nucleoside 2-deoxyribosyltransferase domain-containing protein [Myxococcota bacterium]